MKVKKIIEEPLVFPGTKMLPNKLYTLILNFGLILFLVFSQNYLEEDLIIALVL